jgi:hypothetical protein
MAGLLLLDGAIYLFVRTHAIAQGCILLVLASALIVLGVLWGAKRI